MDNPEEKPFLNQDHVVDYSQDLYIHKHKCRDRNLIILPWILAAASWLITIYLLVHKSETSHDDPRTPMSPPHPSVTTPKPDEAYFNQFPTDLKAMHSAISYEKRSFTNALLWNATSETFYLNATDDEPAFVGAPSDVIDAAWEMLLYNEWTPLTTEEATPYTPELRRWFDGQYRFEPDVMHSLHCLNEIRKRVDIDYYSLPEHKGLKLQQPDWDRIHIDHCIDQMRQTVMCFGDLTPVPLYSWDKAPLGIGKGGEHTCRKWEPIRDWVDQRQKEMDPPKDDE